MLPSKKIYHGEYTVDEDSEGTVGGGGEGLEEELRRRMGNRETRAVEGNDCRNRGHGAGTRDRGIGSRKIGWGWGRGRGRGRRGEETEKEKDRRE
jgi:hypothetical protein